MDDFRAILRENALGETPEVDKAHSTFVGLRDFDKQGLNIILHVRTPPSPFPCTCTPPPFPLPPPLLGLPCTARQNIKHWNAGGLLIGCSRELYSDGHAVKGRGMLPCSLLLLSPACEAIGALAWNKCIITGPCEIMYWMPVVGTASFGREPEKFPHRAVLLDCGVLPIPRKSPARVSCGQRAQQTAGQHAPPPHGADVAAQLPNFGPGGTPCPACARLGATQSSLGSSPMPEG